MGSILVIPGDQDLVDCRNGASKSVGGIITSKKFTKQDTERFVLKSKILILNSQISTLKGP